MAHADPASHVGPHARNEGAAQHGQTVTVAFHAEFACVSCAEAVDRALRTSPHITDVRVDYPGRTVHVTYHAGMTTSTAIQEQISAAAQGCRCTPADGGPVVGGDLPALAHRADMAAVTMGTSADRMQYEFPSTAAGRTFALA